MLSGQSAEFGYLKAGGTYSDQWAFKERRCKLAENLHAGITAGIRH
jgi:hypothetical protein